MPTFFRDSVVLCFWKEFWIAFLIRSSKGILEVAKEVDTLKRESDKRYQNNEPGSSLSSSLSDESSSSSAFEGPSAWTRQMATPCLRPWRSRASSYDLHLRIEGTYPIRRLVWDTKLEPLKMRARIEARVNKNMFILGNERAHGREFVCFLLFWSLACGIDNGWVFCCCGCTQSCLGFR